jgi:hypothetical protein
MTRTLQGTVRGRTIELAEDLGLAEGEQVEVSIRSVSAATQSGDGFTRTEGALADDPHWDDIMAAIHRERKNDVRRETVE